MEFRKRKTKRNRQIADYDREEIRKGHLQEGLIFFLTFVGTTMIAFAFRGMVANPDVNITMFYILGIFVVARYTNGYVWGFLFAVLSVLSVNFFFTYPYRNFNLTLEGYPITFAAMFIIYVFTSAMTTDMKEQARILAHQEKELMEAQKEKLRANLLRAVSHDLRTPLTGIIGNSESYLEMEKKLSDEEKREIVENIEGDANWLLNMVENLLSVTRINNETAKVNKSLEPVDEVISSAVVRFKKRFPEAELKIFPPEDLIMVMMDATLIEQVIINILNNANAHAHSVKPIELKVFEDDDKVWFCIKDYGVGIDEKRLDTIFDGAGYSRDEEGEVDGYKGMGIGLSICKTIVIAHGGDIKAKNHGEGSKFFFYLPKETEE